MHEAEQDHELCIGDKPRRSNYTSDKNDVLFSFLLSYLGNRD